MYIKCICDSISIDKYTNIIRIHIILNRYEYEYEYECECEYK